MNFDLDFYSVRTKRLREKLAEERTFWRLPFLEGLLKSFSPGERLALYTLSGLLALSAFILLIGLNAAISVVVPAHGGSLTEGEVGTARFINPVLALSQPDEDLTQLVYSGLLRATPQGAYIPDLAQGYEISQDGTTYTFHLRQDATFHDGTKVTADDIVFTVHAAQDPAVKSPRRADWEGVEVSAPDQGTVVFKLPHAYAPFLENATMGILPKKVWESVVPEEFAFSPANIRPVGSGPYRVVSVATDSTGSATSYELAPFSRYALGEPYLSRITFMFYPNHDALLQALKTGRIDAVAALSPEDLSSVARTDLSLVSPPLPRVFAAFFNQSHAQILAEASVRQALDAAIDKDALVQSVLMGRGVPLSGPIPPGVLGAARPATPENLDAGATTATTTQDADNLARASALLKKGGWKLAGASSTTPGVWTKGKQTLSLAIATADQPELVATANAVADAWKTLGVQVSVQVYSASELNNNIIRPRAYDVLLFGEVVGRSLDLFAFWHSSQRNDPGLNLAMYANSRVDALLSQGRTTTDDAARDRLYEQFETTIQKDMPAVFLFSPEFTYIIPNTLKGVELGALTTPSERFLNAYQWYAETERVWSVFSDRNE